MKKTLFVVCMFTIAMIQGCKTDSSNASIEEPKQLNISILLDLSDRISPSVHPATPSHQERDLSIINSVVEYFKKDMEKRGTFDANGRIQVFMEPAPIIPGINDLQRKLSVDCSKMDVKQKKEVYDGIESDFNTALAEIYERTIESSNFPGSDIWRFIQNKAMDYCVARDTNYRNILVILTDGYIYDPTTTLRVGNRVQNLTGSTIAKYRSVSDPIVAIQKDDFGLLAPKGVDLSGLEVIVLEISPKQNSQKDESIITYCIDKWLGEMNVQHKQVYSTDLPANTEHRICLFMEE